MFAPPDPMSRRIVLGWLGAGVLAFGGPPQKRKQTMAPIPSHDDERLERYYDTATKYHPAPVPTPLERARAIAFVNSKVDRAAPPARLRKLMRLAVFYDLRETAGAFAALLTGGENQPEDIVRSALAVIALAWIGDPGQQGRAQGYYHALQDRANVDQQRDLMLEVVEAFGPREGTGYHRQWIQNSVAGLGERFRQANAAHDIPGAKLLQEKINALTEYLNIQLARVDRAFSLRQRIEAVDAPTQVKPLVALSIANTPEATPPLSYWASMRLLRLGPIAGGRIAAEFSSQAAALARAGQEFFGARALRAAEYFGYAPAEPDDQLLASQPDTLTDPLVLRPDL
jgi:hypothetical protein